MTSSVMGIGWPVQWWELDD